MIPNYFLGLDTLFLRLGWGKQVSARGRRRQLATASLRGHSSPAASQGAKNQNRGAASSHLMLPHQLTSSPWGIWQSCCPPLPSLLRGLCGAPHGFGAPIPYLEPLGGAWGWWDPGEGALAAATWPRGPPQWGWDPLLLTSSPLAQPRLGRRRRL